MEPQIVLARVYRSKWDAGCNDYLPTLIWPLLPWGEDGTVTIWSYVGQHGGAFLHRIIASTRVATNEQAARAIHQWRSEGPDRSEEEYPILLRRRRPNWRLVRGAHERFIADLRAAISIHETVPA